MARTMTIIRDVAGALAAVLLLVVALLDWSLISFFFLIAFLAVQYDVSQRDQTSKSKKLVWVLVVILSALVIVIEIGFYIAWSLKAEEWITVRLCWAKLLGLYKLNPWKGDYFIYIIISLQLALVIAVAAALYFGECQRSPQTPSLRDKTFGLGKIFNLMLPVLQLLLGIIHPSWIAFPFFLCCCFELLTRCLRYHADDVSWLRKLLLFYTASSVLLLYAYQLPIDISAPLSRVADAIGLFKISRDMSGPEKVFGVSLVLYYAMICNVIKSCNDEKSGIIPYSRISLQQHDSQIQCFPENDLTDHLLPSQSANANSMICEDPVGKVTLQHVAINFLAYGVPATLVIIAMWSFSFQSLCALVLIISVEYVLCTSVSVSSFHRMNLFLLGYILTWALCTYVYNAVEKVSDDETQGDSNICNIMGLSHHSVPGLFLFTQFCLATLVALNIFVCNNIFGRIDTNIKNTLQDKSCIEGEQNNTVLVFALIAWCFHKISRPVALSLIFIMGLKPGLVHALYMGFFLVYLLKSTVGKCIRKTLVLISAVHFAILYFLRLDLIPSVSMNSRHVINDVLRQLGLSNNASPWDFLSLALLFCFSAIQDHGLEILFSFDSILRSSQVTPIGLGFMRAGFCKTVLSVIHSADSFTYSPDGMLQANLITKYLSAIGKKIHTTYRRFGAYIVFVTVLFTVYLVDPNYLSFGYLLCLLMWIIGRQLLERTRRRLWFPLMIYSILAFIIIYLVCSFPALWMKFLNNELVSSNLGLDPDANIFDNIWDSTAILVVMQLFRYEREQNLARPVTEDTEDAIHCENIFLGFVKRFIIWHSGKILSVTVFYASISPVSVVGFIFLTSMVFLSNFPKRSHLPAKIYATFTGILIIGEYLFQILAGQFQMLPEQKYAAFSSWLGFRTFENGFRGIEIGLRSKVLVIVACLIQYNAFRWLELLPKDSVCEDKWAEPCHLFSLCQNHNEKCISQHKASSIHETIQSDLILNDRILSRSVDGTSDLTLPDDVHSNDVFGSFWGSFKDSERWNRRILLALKSERYEAQIRTLKLYVKFWVENLFNLYGLEINMIMLLLASFTVLNAISLVYVLALCLCILLGRRTLHSLWPMFVLLFSCILLLEYVALADSFAPWSRTDVRKVHCHECWNSSKSIYSYCAKCWLGTVVDDRQMLVSYFLVFFFASFKLRGNLSGGYTESDSYNQLRLEKADRLVWKEIAFETKGPWTWLDHFRLFFFRHLLDAVLMLVLITGTLEYDVLHLGYLAFAMVSFRARDRILKRQTKIFKYLRLYNISLIILSLAFQAPFFGYVEKGRCSLPDALYGLLGLYKYDYGFKITSRSALIDIVIFCLVGLQSHIFKTRTYDQVIKYLEAEQIDAILHAQEKRAAWKTKQLQHIREIEDRKQKRRMQVEKMKAEMSHMQGHSVNTPLTENITDFCMKPQTSQTHSRDKFPESHLRHRSPELHSIAESSVANIHGNALKSELETNETTADVSEITEIPTYRKVTRVEHSSSVDAEKGKEQKDNPLASAVQLIGDGVAQVHSLGNQAVSNLVNFFNIEKGDFDSSDMSSVEERENEIAYNQETGKSSAIDLDNKSSIKLARQDAVCNGKWQWLSKLSCYCWSKVRSNTDTICYCCFVFVFLWNFSLLSMVYLVALFAYALLVKPAPSSLFWISILIYTEVIILAQYVYQIMANHCGPHLDAQLQQRIGLCSSSESSSFVVTVFPLFIVYLFTLLQCSIKAKDSEWMSVNEFAFLNRRFHSQLKHHARVDWNEKLWSFVQTFLNFVRMIGKALRRYWKSLTHGSEAPPHFVQVSMYVGIWPEYGIQPERIESGINRVLEAYHIKCCTQNSNAHSVSRVRVESIEKSSEDSNVALAVFEVIYASSLKACPASTNYMTLKPAADVASELQKAKELGIIDEIGFPFPIRSIIAGGKREIDLYAYIFCADLVAFFLVAIFYQSMIKHNEQFLDVYQLEDQFPKEFVFVLMVLFFLIVVDRIIYLWSFALGKVIYYFFSLVLFTYSVTVYAWNMEAKGQLKHNGQLALRAFYFTKAISLTLEALQIKFGLPNKSALYGQFLTSRITNVNYLGFRLYRALPFLYELRCVLDWSCTATSLTMYDWLKLEDIYASLYLVKCDITLSRAKHQLGEKQSKTTKFWSGICLFLVLIFVIWAPMLMYSSGNPTNIVNPVKNVMTQLDVQTKGGRLTLYQNSLCQCFMWDDLLADGYKLDPQGYLKTYDSKDIQLICCQADANVYFMVPPSAIKNFIASVSEDIDVSFLWEFTRDRPKGKEVVKYVSPEPVSSYGLRDVLNGTKNAVKMLNIYPRYIRLTGSGEAHKLEQTDTIGANGSLTLNWDSQFWWSFYDDKPSEGCGNLKGPSAFVFSEETPQGFIGETLSKFSIWSLYITFVLAVGRFIRLQCSDLRMRIPYENFPSCDRLIAICEDTYAARAEGELVLEELLFLTLVDIYRSPHVLIEYTKRD